MVGEKELKKKKGEVIFFWTLEIPNAIDTSSEQKRARYAKYLTPFL